MKKQTVVLSFILVVVLSAFTAPIQFLSTSIRITVLDALGNPVPDAEVTLYHTEEEYRQEENAASETVLTDRKGRVKIKDLEPKVYFVDVVKEEMTNAGAGVQTDTLREGRINKVNIIIE
ncbi:carboxypeptidase-like regulatory domain-containing protein [Nafulsella turpanensis]|uniref:carboxypeptidase-like regulatory domain-containing protein n=1 Tax=Nafulsella turpanensis TaxID=1265690 RepID=UPI000348769B|nr:carboxypeptidase-like regulatory domain-containing protein [Nafulsella turpanensis]